MYCLNKQDKLGLKRPIVWINDIEQMHFSFDITFI